MYFFLLLGLCLLIPFRFHMQVDDRRHTSPPFTINMTFLCMPAVSSWARYILVFRLLSFHGRQGGRFIAAFSFLDNFFVPGIPHVVILCVWLLSVLVSSMAVPIHCQPLRSEASVDNSATAPRLGKNTPPSSSFCGSRLVLLDNLVSYCEYLMDSLVADIFVHIDTA